MTTTHKVDYTAARGCLASMTDDPAMLEAFDAAIAEMESKKHWPNCGPAQDAFIDGVYAAGLSLDAIFVREAAA